MANAIADDVLALDDSHRAFLENLPPQLSLDVEGCSVLLVHGSPRANNEDILPGMPLDVVEEIIEGIYNQKINAKYKFPWNRLFEVEVELN